MFVYLFSYNCSLEKFGKEIVLMKQRQSHDIQKWKTKHIEEIKGDG